MNSHRTARRRGLSVIAPIVLLAVGSLAACTSPGDAGTEGPQPGDLGSWAEIEAAAKQEGQVVLYTTAADDLNLPEIEAFQKAYPEITVISTRLPAGELTARYSSEHEANAPTADVIRMANSLVMDDNPDWFLPLDETNLPNLAELPDKYVHGHYFNPLAAELLFTRNTDLLPASEVPTTWEDFLPLAQKTKGILWDPKGAATFASFYQKLRDWYGDDFLKALGATGQTYAGTLADSMQAAAAGQGAWVVPGQDAHSKNLRDQGAPLAISPMTPSTGPVYAVGIDSRAAHPNAALVYLNWMLSNDGPAAACATGLVPTSPTTNPACSATLPADFEPLEDAKGAKELDTIIELLGLG